MTRTMKMGTLKVGCQLYSSRQMKHGGHNHKT